MWDPTRSQGRPDDRSRFREEEHRNTEGTVATTPESLTVRVGDAPKLYQTDHTATTTLQKLTPRVGAAPTMYLTEDTEIVDFTYENQKIERGKRASTLVAQFDANWPCMWGEAITGAMETKARWGKYMDGWKFTCGLSLITEPCVVYSLGSSGNMAFEVGVLKAKPHCETHIFDKDSFGLEQWFPTEDARARVKFHRAFIAERDDLAMNPPHRSLASIMKELGHTHIDLLKMDIEGAEYGALSQSLPSIGQLQLEAHTKLQSASAYSKLFEHLEAHGLRLFHKEVNARYCFGLKYSPPSASGIAFRLTPPSLRLPILWSAD